MLTKLAIPVIAAMAAVIAFPGTTVGQGNECVFGCHCTPTGGCACQEGWGAARDCVLPAGGGCEVIACEKLEGFLFGADGSVFAVASAPESGPATRRGVNTAMAELQLRSAVVRRDASAQEGQLLRHCTGVVMLRVRAKSEARVLREADRKMVL